MQQLFKITSKPIIFWYKTPGVPSTHYRIISNIFEPNDENEKYNKKQTIRTKTKALNGFMNQTLT